MSNTPNPLQGSLFGKGQEAFQGNNSSPLINDVPGKDLSNEALTKDSSARPRKRKNTLSNNFNASPRREQQKSSQKNSDLPQWSHHTLVPKDKLTPVLSHYVELKEEHPDRVLLYRLGDFFECFFEDAIKVSRLLELTLTGKEGGKAVGRVPMAGVPHHAAERYCSELIKKGLSVELCDQLEVTPKKGSLIKRGITRVLTPGTVIEEGLLEARKNNWLTSIVIQEKENKNFRWGIAKADISTGEFSITEFEGKDALNQEVNKIQAAEIIYGSRDDNIKDWLPESLNITQMNLSIFSKPSAENTIKKYYKLKTIDNLGLEEWSLALRAAGGLLSYIQETKPLIKDEDNQETLNRIKLDSPKKYFLGESLIIDAQTRRNLEITNTQRDGNFQGSLLWAIDQTLTAMGGRCLRRWLETPLLSISLIKERQSVINDLVESRPLRKSIQKLLRAMGDLERLAGRAGAGQAGARDIVAIANGLERLPALALKLQELSEGMPAWLKSLITIDPQLIKLASDIRHQIVDQPPLSLTEGGLIYDGIDPLLDGLRNQFDDHQNWLKKQEKLEKEISGFSNLRLQYHRTFGYFIAIRKSKADQVPSHWIRRQTLANEERFITPLLKEKEGKIMQAKIRSSQREYELFCNLRNIVGLNTALIRKVARSIAGLDALTSLAEVAATNYYCKPEIIENLNQKSKCKMILKNSRHPVVEQMMADNSFQANNLNLGENCSLIILTGPNASGKSCYLRQIGLIQLMAQIGSWVPAEKAAMNIADQIFTRVGAVDDLAAGKSTFMVEMAETAYILQQATNKSLILLDEIGRGTATFDGLSIAWSVSEFIAKEIKSRAIFATHYHELNELCETNKNVSNFQVLVKQTDDELFFLHKVVPGGANRSYGIEAARLAGLPKSVIDRAKELLINLEKKKI